MSRILIISDSHGYNEWVEIAIKQARPFDMLFHCGDLQCPPEEIEKMAGGSCYMVRGNCDPRLNLPLTQVVDVEGHRIYMAHGHTLGVGYDLDSLLEEAAAVEADIALFGHTHRPYVDIEDDIYLFNPGSVSQPRQESREKTYGILEISDKGTISFEHKVLGKKQL